MAKIRFENGTVVNFDGNPTPQDVDFVAKQIGITPSSSQPSIEQQKQQRISQGLPVSVKSDRAEPTMAGNIIRGIAKPFAKAGVSIGGVTQGISDLAKSVPTQDTELLKKSKQELERKMQEGVKTNYLGTVYPIGAGVTKEGEHFTPTSGDFGKSLLSTVGTGLELASNIPIAKGAQLGVQGLRTGLRGVVKSALPAAIEGGVGGTLAGTGEALQRGAPIEEALTQGAIGGATGFAGGGALGVGGNVAGRAVNRLRGISNISNRITPKLNPDEAVGQIIQGSKKDIQLGLKALKSIDTQSIKTFDELNTAFEQRIPQLADIVDNELLKDTTLYKLDDLASSLETKSGVNVSQNFVEDSLKHLSEFYESIGDMASKADIDFTIAKAQTEGLTRKEVNDIARVYGSEFGNKAFNKIGDPLTSVNAQKFENTRKGLKSVARQGIGGQEAKEADELISAIYNTKRLVEKNIEAVNKLRQKIQGRGLVEKAGYLLSKYADILTGGGIRGIVGGILPRGVGYKTMNAIDIEEALVKNLKTIQKAIDSKSDVATINSIMRLNQSIPRNAIEPKTSTNNIPQKPPTSPAIISNANNTVPATSLGNNSVIPPTIPSLPVKKKLPAKPSLSKEVDNLTKEARKYKSAEEFVKAQADKQIEELIKESGTGTVKIYHGTDVESANLIKKSGLFKSSENQPSFFTKSKKEALEYARNKSKYRGKEPEVMEIEVPKWAITKNNAGEIETHLGVPLYREFGNVYRPKDEELLRAFGKPQLTDIWNKANGK